MVGLCIYILYGELLVILILYLTKRKPIFLLIGLFLMLAGSIAIYNYEFKALPLKLISQSYHILAVQISESWKRGDYFQFSPLSAHNLFIIMTGAPLYFIFGPSLLFIKIANVTYSVFIVYNVYRIAVLWFQDQKTGLWASTLFVFSPYLLFTLGTTARDPLVLFLLSESLYLITVIIKFKNYKKVPIFFLTLYAIWILREELGGAVFGTLMILFVLYLMRLKISSIGLAGLQKILVAIMILGTLQFGLFVLHKKPDLVGFRKGITLERFEARRNPHGRSPYLEEIRLDNPKDAILNLPLSAFYFMFAPLPWQVKSAKHFLGMIDSLYLLTIFILSYRGIRQLKWNNKAIYYIVVLYLVGGILGSALIQANVGAAMRHRMMFSFIFYILSSYHVHHLFGRMHLSLRR